MPCDQIILNSVDLGKMNATLLTKALKALGTIGSNNVFMLDGVTCRIAGDRLVVPAGKEHLADQIKRAYSVQTVKKTAERNGWTLRKIDQFVYEVEK